MKNKSADWPKHGDYVSARDFRAAKRRDVREALKAVSALRLGCAFTPAYEQILNVDTLLVQIQDSLSVSRWKR